MREDIVLSRREHPEWTLAQIGKVHGVTRERVRQILVSEGLPTKRVLPKRERVKIPTVTWMGSGDIVLGKGDVCAITELLVCIDLVRRGHDVYRAVSATSPSDLVAFINGKCRRIEVKAARFSNERWKGGRGFSRKENFDILAMVAPNGDIRYKPDVPWSRKKKRGASGPAG